MLQIATAKNKKVENVRLYTALWNKLKKARAKGFSVDFQYREQEKDKTLIVDPHLIVLFLHDYKIRRAKQRGKKTIKVYYSSGSSKKRCIDTLLQ